ncbi:unnamed protein product [Ceutorhynchus assimilis]|uniref:Calcium release-activated calcium channel protein 1 n=1 Tax=Ceutorhynchus assimilis TaxID=467358 RepID=A0A9N9MPQ1_9CUCU|nr:unnamed protein product [Ceutorhynchus assimilis]
MDTADSSANDKIYQPSISSSSQDETETSCSLISEQRPINGKKSVPPIKVPLTRPTNFSRNNRNTGVPKFCELMYVWSTSAVGMNADKPTNKYTSTENIQLFNRGHNKPKKLSMSDDILHTPNYLSWRKMHLSKAKLKASSKTSALLSGFAMVAMVELQLNNETSIPPPVLVVFAVITTLLVAVHMLALMISTCILPNIETVCSLESINFVDESPHERLHWYIEIAWAFSTLLGLLLFLAEIAIICWLKFYHINTVAAWSATIVLIPVLFVFLAFAIHFYRSLVAHKYEISMKELKRMNDQIGDVSNKLFRDESVSNNIQVV